MMEYKEIAGPSGSLSMPMLGFGTWLSRGPDLQGAMKEAFNYGFRHFDTAWSYGSEKDMGVVLGSLLESGSVRREDLFITTKLSPFHMRSDLVRLSLEQSLEWLQLDYVDLFLIHIPQAMKNNDDDVPPSSAPEDLFENATNTNHDFVSSWQAMEPLVEDGLTKAIGVSNLNEQQIGRIVQVAKMPVSINQVEVHVHFQQNPLQKFCADHGIPMMAFGPLGSPGFVKRDIGPMQEPVVQQIAEDHKKTVAQILLRYSVQRGMPTLTKSMKPERLKQALDVFSFTLSDNDMQALANLDKDDRHLPV